MDEAENEAEQKRAGEAREYTTKQLIKYHATVMHNVAERALAAQENRETPIASLQVTLEKIIAQAIEGRDGHMQAILIRPAFYSEAEEELKITKEVTAYLKNTLANIRAHETVEQLLFHCQILNHISARPEC